MAKISRSELLSRAFQDPKNYPYGFSRSGDFSISESKALCNIGNLYHALLAGEIPAETEEDKHFLAVAKGDSDPKCVEERAWVKYVARVNRTRTGSIYGSQKAESSDEDFSSDDVIEETDVVLDDTED